MATIPISEDDGLVQHTGTNGQTVVSFPFWVEAEEDLELYIDGTLKTLTTDYTVAASGLKNDNGGSLTLTSALSGGEAITVYRNTEIDRATGFSESGAASFRGESINLELSRLVVMMQERKRDIDRCVRLSPFSTYAGSLLLPTASAGKALLWAADGLSIINSTDNFNDIVTNATTQANNAAASATAAAASATAAATAKTNAETAETNAETAQAAAEAAQAAAEAAVASAGLPASLTGQAGKGLKVKGDETGYEHFALTTANIAEVTNLYYTTARFNADLATKTTDNLSEGASNLYFTDERAMDAIAAFLTAGSNVTLTHDDGANTLEIAAAADIPYNHAIKTDTFSTSSTSWTDVTGLSVNITSPSATATYLILAHISVGMIYSTNDRTGFRLTDGSNNAIDVGDAAGSRSLAGGCASVGSNNSMNSIMLAALWTPGSSGAHTAKVRCMAGGSGTVYVNRSNTDTDNSGYFRSASTITAIRVDD